MAEVVVIVEHVAQHYDFMRNTLEAHCKGVKCVQADRPIDAREVAQAHDARCIILDDKFPDPVLGGQTPWASQFMVDLTLPLPVVVVTGYFTERYPQVDGNRPFLTLRKPDCLLAVPARTAADRESITEFVRQLVQATSAALYCARLLRSSGPPSAAKTRPRMPWVAAVTHVGAFVVGAIMSDVAVRVLKALLRLFAGP